MHIWFECGIKYEKTADGGRIVKVNESYLVDALTHGEAEERINKEMEPFISGEFSVLKVRRARINEMFFNEEGDKWYRCKVYFISLDEEKGVEKRVAVSMMVQANDIKEAWDGLKKGMNGTLADYVVAAITETNIMDVYKYEESAQATEEKKEVVK